MLFWGFRPYNNDWFDERSESSQATSAHRSAARREGADVQKNNNIYERSEYILLFLPVNFNLLFILLLVLYISAVIYLFIILYYYYLFIYLLYLYIIIILYIIYIIYYTVG